MLITTAREAIVHRWPAFLVPLLALLLVFPLLRGGPSCGHDFGFHMQSWLDASDQVRHGTLFPHWAFSPAFNAGEPRFLFYPPLSWLLGSTLMLVLPASVVPAAFTFCALALAGLGMGALARQVTSPSGAVLASTLYLVNPYMLFTAFERTAYAELLAAAWMPWLLRAALADQPEVLSIAWPLALLWLTNAPAAVMGTYALAFLLLLRLAQHFIVGTRRQGVLPGAALKFASAGAGGLLLGLGLACFYLLPAAVERRYVQIAMAIIPNMRVEDNFLFGHTGYGPHDEVLHTASLVATSLIGLTILTLAAAGLRTRHQVGASTPQGLPHRAALRLRLWWLLPLAIAIMLLQLPASLPAWHRLPELAFLQFPWRWMSVLGCIFALAAALALGDLPIPAAVAIPVALVLAGSAAPLALQPFRQGCEAFELPAARVALFRTGHGVGPTDEYTPGDADNDQLRWDDPAWWLTRNPNAPAPGTVPNPAATILNYDEPPPLSQTVSGRAPTDLDLQLSAPQDLVLNLRAYPAWRIRVNEHPARLLDRDDGLVALALPAGRDHVEIRWRRLPDMWIGDGLSLAALLLAGGIGFRRVESKRKA